MASPVWPTNSAREPAIRAVLRAPIRTSSASPPSRRWLTPCLETYINTPDLTLLAVPELQMWRFHAACRNWPDPDLFFPNPREFRRSVQARRVCTTCPVVEECLRAATRDGDSCGIRGGLTEKERERLRGKQSARPDLRLVYANVLAAAAGQHVKLSRREADLLCAYAEANDIPWQTWGIALGIKTRSGAWKRMEKSRIDAGDPDRGPERRRDLAVLKGKAERDAPRRMVRMVAA